MSFSFVRKKQVSLNRSPLSSLIIMIGVGLSPIRKDAARGCLSARELLQQLNLAHVSPLDADEIDEMTGFGQTPIDRKALLSFSDITLVVGGDNGPYEQERGDTEEELDDFTTADGRHFYLCHRSILAARSAYFAALFRHNMRDCAEKQHYITDVAESIEVFECLLCFMYGECELSLPSAQHAVDMITLATRFGINDDRLLLLLEHYLLAELCEETVEVLRELCQQCPSLKHLQREITEFFPDNGDNVTK